MSAATLDPPAKTFTTRTYQVEAEQCAYSDWAAGLLRIVISLPTGMGKTVILGHITCREVSEGKRVVIMVNRDELVTQTVDTMRALCPEGTTIGVVQGPRHQVDADVIVASIQTLGRSSLRREAIGYVSLVIVDECHHGAAASYVDSVRDLGGFIGTRVLGTTATAARNDGLGMGDLWQKVTYSKTIEYAFAHGFLVKPTIIREYLRGVDLTPEHAARVWEREAGDQRGMVLVGTVREAEAYRKAFVARGIAAEVIEGKLSASKRKSIYAATIADENKVLISVSCLTEGFDMPCLTFLMIARSIGSQTVYVQGVGRVLRLSPGKDHAYVCDLSGASAKWATKADPFGLTVKADLSKTAPGKRPVRKIEGVRYKMTNPRAWYGLRQTRVIRVEGNKRTKVATIRVGTRSARENVARLKVRRIQANEAGLNGPEWGGMTGGRTFGEWANSGFHTDNGVPTADELMQIGRRKLAEWVDTITKKGA